MRAFSWSLDWAVIRFRLWHLPSTSKRPAGATAQECAGTANATRKVRHSSRSSGPGVLPVPSTQGLDCRTHYVVMVHGECNPELVIAKSGTQMFQIGTAQATPPPCA